MFILSGMINVKNRGMMRTLNTVVFALMIILLGSHSGQVFAADRLEPAHPDSLQTLRIGILSHRPIEEAEAYWKPLQSALEAALPDLRFELVLSDFARLDDLVHRAAVDLVLTNPNHYIQLRDRQPGMWALASTIEEVQGQLLPLLGGVIVVRAEDEHLQSLADLAGRPVAAVNPQSLGGYRT